MSNLILTFLFAGTFIIQTKLCFSNLRWKMKVIPTAVLILGILGCMGIVTFARAAQETPDALSGIPYYAFVQQFALMLMLLLDTVAWAIWGVTRALNKVAQKRRK